MSGKITASVISEWMIRGEDSSLEFKRARKAIPDNFWETYSAFANTDGGVVVLGVDEPEPRKYVVEGVDDAKKIVVDFWNTVHGDKVSASLCFESDVSIVQFKGKYLVVVTVPRAAREDRPVCVGTDVFKGSFRRNADGDYACSREAVKAMLRDQCIETADAMAVEEFSLDDLDAGTISRYRMRFSNRKPDHVWNGLGNEAFLLKIGAARRLRDGSIHPTLAGLVCFADYNTITNVLGDYFLDYREKDGASRRWSDRVCAQDGTWSGNIYDFYFLVRDRLTKDVPNPFALDEGGFSRVPDTPVHRGLREVLANALIHADYHGRRGIVIEKCGRTITASNPGLMRISRSDAISGGMSDARNAKIFNIFSLVDVGERSGMGISDFFGTWRGKGWREPQLSESFEPDRTTVSLSFEVDDNESGVDDKVDDKDDKVDDEWTIKFNALPPIARQVYALLQTAPNITYGALSSKLNLSRAYVAKGIAALVENKFIRRGGAKKNGYWILSQT